MIRCDLTFKIVRYDSKYQEAVIDLWKKCDSLVSKNDPVQDIQRKMEFQPDLFLVALVRDSVIGSVMIGYEGHRGWINYLAVAPEYQRRGYGKRLIKKSIDELRKLGCLKINLQVRNTNRKAVDFYRHLGFKEDNVTSLGLRLDTKS